MAVCNRNGDRLAIVAGSEHHLCGPAEDISRPKAEKHLEALPTNSHKLTTKLLTFILLGCVFQHEV